MAEQPPYISLLYYILPSFILDSFELVDIKDIPVDNPTHDLLYPSVLHLYIDERDNRTDEQQRLFKPNGFTEVTQVRDFPMRDRKTVFFLTNFLRAVFRNRQPDREQPGPCCTPGMRR